MDLRRRLAAAALLCGVCSVPAAARAFALSADVGAAAAVPTGLGPSFAGGAAGVGIVWSLSEHHGLGLTLRTSVVTPVAWSETDDGVPVARSGAHPSAQLLSTYRLVMGAGESWGAQFVVGLGFGLWPSCVRGDMCGGGGIASLVQGAVRRRVGDKTVLLFGLELATQFGMGNLVDVMLMPGAFAGIESSL